MLVTSEERADIIALLDEIERTGIVTDEMTEYIDSKWLEFITISLTYQDSRYQSILNIFVEAADGKLNIEYHTYLDLIAQLGGTKGGEYLDSVVEYTIDYME